MPACIQCSVGWVIACLQGLGQSEGVEVACLPLDGLVERVLVDRDGDGTGPPHLRTPSFNRERG
jgi:hypothetical protein